MAKKIKAPAIHVPTDPMDVDALIFELGAFDRHIAELKTDAEGQIALIEADYKRKAMRVQEQVAENFKRIQAYCEAHKDELLPDPELKTATFASGTVAWKKRPPSVEFKKGLKVEDIVQVIKDTANELMEKTAQSEEIYEDNSRKAIALLQLIRTKQEINKEAVLEKPELIDGISALYIRKDVEDFIVTPTETKLPNVKVES